jgi:hypothetical protein
VTGIDTADSLTFYSLDSVPDIIKLFNQRIEKKILDGVMKQIQIFDPNDDYWLGDY